MSKGINKDNWVLNERVKINGPSEKQENTHCSQSCYCHHIHTSHIHLKEDKNMYVHMQVNRTFVCSTNGAGWVLSRPETSTDIHDEFF